MKATPTPISRRSSTTCRPRKPSDGTAIHAASCGPVSYTALLYSLHTAPKHIGEAARDAGVKRLLLSHTAPDVQGASRSVVESIRASYKGPVSFAHDKLRVPATTLSK